MDKSDQIILIADVIKDLCGLIFVIETHAEYTQEQAAKYYREIFEMHNLSETEEECGI